MHPSLTPFANAGFRVRERAPSPLDTRAKCGRTRLLALAIIAAALGARTAAAQDGIHYIDEKAARENNLVDNGGFEAVDPKTQVPRAWHVDEQWAPGSDNEAIVVESTTSASGKNSLRIAGGQRSQYAVSSRMPIHAGRDYTLLCTVKQTSAPDAGTAGWVQMAWYPRDNKAKREAAKHFRGAFGWSDFIIHVRAPDDARTLAIYLFKSSVGTVWFDDLVLAEGLVPRPVQSMALRDYIQQYTVYESMHLDLRRFMAFRAKHLSPQLSQRKSRVLSQILEMREEFKRAAFDKGLKETALHRAVEAAFSEPVVDSEYRYKPIVDNRYSEYRRITSDIASLKASIHQHIKQTLPKRTVARIRSAFGERAEYGLGIATGMHKVLKHEPYLGDIAASASVSLAGNEHEGFQIIVLPLEKSLRRAQVIISDLATKGGRVLSADNVKVYPVGFVKTEKPENPVDYVGWWPDPLLRDDSADVEKGTCQPFWIDVHVPPGTPAGVYRGSVTVKPANSHELPISLSVTVWDFELPHKGKFKVFGRFRPDKLLPYYKWESIPEDIELAWYLFQVEHRYSPMDMFGGDLTPTSERGILEKCLRAGHNSVLLMNVRQHLTRTGSHSWEAPSEAQRNRIRLLLEERRAVLERFDALDTGFVFGFDEVPAQAMTPVINETFELAKSVVPEAKRATTAVKRGIVDRIAKNVDVWVPLLGRSHRELEILRQKRPDAEIYYYIFGEPKHPFPNASLIDYPALDGRISFWMMFRRNITGFLHWYVNGWEANFRGTEKRWPGIPWKPYCGERYAGRRNGEGYLIYPGPDGLPISSIRFENIRDGIEDWEMMNALRELIGTLPVNHPARLRAEKALASVSDIVPTNYIYTNDPAELLSRRETIARAIEGVRSSRRD